MPLLEPHLVGWLCARICPAADAHELDRPYAFRHDLNGSRRIDAAMVDDCLNWEIKFQTPAGDELTEDHAPVHRAVGSDAGLWSGPGTGKVATNKALILKEPYHRQLFATALYGAETALYSRWNIREVQMVAMAAGREVWPTMGFVPKEPEALRFAFRTWLRQQATPPREPPAELVDYPPEFLRTLSYLQLYKVL